jgi:hypothetical protein
MTDKVYFLRPPKSVIWFGACLGAIEGALVGTTTDIFDSGVDGGILGAGFGAVVVNIAWTLRRNARPLTLTLIVAATVELIGSFAIFIAARWFPIEAKCSSGGLLFWSLSNPRKNVRCWLQYFGSFCAQWTMLLSFIGAVRFSGSDLDDDATRWKLMALLGLLVGLILGAIVYAVVDLIADHLYAPLPSASRPRHVATDAASGGSRTGTHLVDFQ